MGKKGREVVEGDVNLLIKELQKAHADEWIAFYYYTLASEVAEGRTSPMIIDALKDLAKDELEHASELAERIIELGSEPTTDFAQLTKVANYPEVKLPKDPKDLDGIVNAVIEAERGAIDVYNNLLKKLMKDWRDPVTFHIIRHIMQEEVAHEERMEDIL
ncbi:MAG: ferritin-like domain-containing protein [Nitrososphaerales archaeon]